MTLELAYFLKINAGIALFYAFYRLFFYKDTFFYWRRTALLCFFALSLAYPLLNLQEWIRGNEPMVAMADLYADVVLPEWTISTESQSQAIDWKNRLLTYGSSIYWVGVALLLFRFLIQLGCIIRLQMNCRTEMIEGTRVHLLKKEAGSFSFFHWIFVHPTSHTESEISEILTHESTHARQYHSADVLFSELMCMACWFNPFAWLMKREVRINLEYMADNRVIQNGYDHQTYQFHLLGLAHQKTAVTLSNSFNVLPLKNRIKMMNKKRTKEIGRAKYLMFIPLAALLMVISNIEAVARTTEKFAKEIVQAVEPGSTSVAMTPEVLAPAPPQEKKKTGATVNDNTIFEVVEQIPLYPGGMEALVTFLGTNVRYPAEAHAKGTQGRVIIQFVVEKDGTLSNYKVVKSVAPSLDAEAIRVVTTLPKWTPGKQNGKEVRVRFTIPVMFRLTEDAPAMEIKTDDISEVIVVGFGSQEEEVKEEVVFTVAEQMPKFPGGIEALMKHLARNIKYPTDAQESKTEGQVIAEIVIDKEGNVTAPAILKGVSPSLNAEAIRVLKTLPKWEPGMQRGQAVAVKYTLPIMFKLQLPSPKPAATPATKNE